MSQRQFPPEYRGLPNYVVSEMDRKKAHEELWKLNLFPVMSQIEKLQNEFEKIDKKLDIILKKLDKEIE